MVKSDKEYYNKILNGQKLKLKKIKLDVAKWKKEKIGIEATYKTVLDNRDSLQR